MAKNHSPASKAYHKRRMVERNAAGRVALPVLLANWPELFASALPFTDSIIDELYAATVARGFVMPRAVIQMAIVAHMRKSSYKKRMKSAVALRGLYGEFPITAAERDQRYAVYMAQFFNFTGRPLKTPRPAKPVF